MYWCPHNTCPTFLSIGDYGTFAILSAELPTVERALDAVADHSTSYGKICAKVRAVGIHGEHFAIQGTVHGELFTWKRRTNQNTDAIHGIPHH